MTKETFIQKLQTRADAFIGKIWESDEHGIVSFNIELMEGVDKGQFGYSLIKFINENKTDDVFDIWVNAYGEDFGAKAECYPINADYDDDTEHMEADEQELFTITVDGKTLEVLREDFGGCEYTIYDNQEYLVTLYPEPTGSDAFNWKTKSIVPTEPINVSPEYAKAIGEAIELAEK